MKVARRSVAVLVTAGALLSAPLPASAATPANDTPQTATVVTSLPFTDSISTVDATTDATDTAINTNCGAPATEASVWYVYTPSADGSVVADVSGSDFSAGLIAATGSPGNLSLLGCGPGSIVVPATAGDPIYLMAFDDTPGGTNGGQLNISITPPPPAPVVGLTVDPVASFNARTGVATITGTVTCANGSYLSISAELHQTVGRLRINGYGYLELECKASQKFSIEITGDNGKFAGGKASTIIDGFSCGPIDCADTSVPKTISLKK